MFFDLFQFVFHLDDKFLHLGMVAFRTKGVDFTSHFLGDETEFLTLSVSALHRADVIFQVVVQEMGREINTLGSKSNHAEMQRIVVRMKDELEQIKEQVLNVM